MAGERRSRRLAMLLALAGGGRPALLTVLSGVSNEARGAVLGLNITFFEPGLAGSQLVPHQGARLVVAGTER